MLKPTQAAHAERSGRDVPTRTYVRLFADAAGESHFEDHDLEFREARYAASAPPVQVSAYVPTVQCAVLTVPPGWHGGWHQSPRRVYVFFLAGEMQFTASDRETRTLQAGEILLLEDTTGAGHDSRVSGPGEVVVAIAHLPD